MTTSWGGDIPVLAMWEVAFNEWQSILIRTNDGRDMQTIKDAFRAGYNKGVESVVNRKPIKNLEGTDCATWFDYNLTPLNKETSKEREQRHKSFNERYSNPWAEDNE